jgi:hypothetical protein
VSWEWLPHSLERFLKYFLHPPHPSVSMDPDRARTAPGHAPSNQNLCLNIPPDPGRLNTLHTNSISPKLISESLIRGLEIIPKDQ